MEKETLKKWQKEIVMLIRTLVVVMVFSLPLDHYRATASPDELVVPAEAIAMLVSRDIEEVTEIRISLANAGGKTE